MVSSFQMAEMISSHFNIKRVPVYWSFTSSFLKLVPVRLRRILEKVTRYLVFLQIKVKTIVTLSNVIGTGGVGL